MRQATFWAIAPFTLLTILGKPLFSFVFPFNQAVVNFSYTDENSTKSEIVVQDIPTPKVTPLLETIPTPKVTPLLETIPTPKVTPLLETTPTVEESPSPESTSPPKEQEVILQQKGTLSDGDLVLPSDESIYDEHTFEGKEGQVVFITLESPSFDTYLAVFSPTNELLGENDDVDENNKNSQLTITLTITGEYRVIVNSYDKTGRGEYDLQVIQSGQTSDF
ncbi:MAG: peptidase [Trichodesmium sp. MAG_R04]|nr:peptidase [Trichodesmium sp. MAG_R04]